MGHHRNSVITMPGKERRDSKKLEQTWENWEKTGKTLGKNWENLQKTGETMGKLGKNWENIGNTGKKLGKPWEHWETRYDIWDLKLGKSGKTIWHVIATQNKIFNDVSKEKLKIWYNPKWKWPVLDNASLEIYILAVGRSTAGTIWQRARGLASCLPGTNWTRPFRWHWEPGHWGRCVRNHVAPNYTGFSNPLERAAAVDTLESKASPAWNTWSQERSLWSVCKLCVRRSFP